jgi:hypothetical protein
MVPGTARMLCDQFPERHERQHGAAMVMRLMWILRRMLI